MIRNIVFDFGGVLVDWNPRYLYEKLSSDQEKLNTFLTDVCPLYWNHELDAGKPFLQAIAERTHLFPEYEEWIKLYETRWNEMIRSEISGTVTILEDLAKKKIPLFGLTNWSNETFPLALKRFSFFNYFQGIVVSGKEGCIKPNPKIFKILLERYSINPNETLFIDDLKKNTDAASLLGFQTHTFTDPKQLQMCLTDEFKIL